MLFVVMYNMPTLNKIYLLTYLLTDGLSFFRLSIFDLTLPIFLGLTLFF